MHYQPRGQPPYTARILAQPFGSRAPENWGRVVTFAHLVALKLLYLAVGAFTGDVYCDEDAKIANSGFWAFKQLRRLLGFNTSDRKGRNPSTGLTPKSQFPVTQFAHRLVQNEYSR